MAWISPLLNLGYMKNRTNVKMAMLVAVSEYERLTLAVARSSPKPDLLLMPDSIIVGSPRTGASRGPARPGEAIRARLTETRIAKPGGDGMKRRMELVSWVAVLIAFVALTASHA